MIDKKILPKMSYEEKEISLSLRRKRHMEKHRDEFSDFDETFES